MTVGDDFVNLPSGHPAGGRERNLLLVSRKDGDDLASGDAMPPWDVTSTYQFRTRTKPRKVTSTVGIDSCFAQWGKMQLDIGAILRISY